MIDLNSFSEDANTDVSIFNNGNAGRVENVTVSVKKKSAEDKANSPDYKVFLKDANGEMNEGIYYIKEGDNAIKFKLSRLIQMAQCANPEMVGVDLPQFPSYEKATDFLMQKINEGSKKGNKVNIFAAYGNEGYPKQYLTLRGINFIEPASKTEDASRLNVVNSSDPSKSQYNDIMFRPTPDNDTTEDVFAEDATPSTEAEDDFGF
tara:strand:+ start:15061 stop:15678 length:618 start_codon:yes stop_codon:yes gene_type:complete